MDEILNNLKISEVWHVFIYVILSQPWVEELCFDDKVRVLTGIVMDIKNSGTKL